MVERKYYLQFSIISYNFLCSTIYRLELLGNTVGSRLIWTVDDRVWKMVPINRDRRLKVEYRKVYTKTVIRSFKDLEVYKEGYELAIIVNREVNKLPIFEKNDLGSQMRRCSKSPPANIAEGWAKRRFPKEFKRHIDSAIGSSNEMEVHISMARDLGYWPKDFCNKLIQRYIHLGGKLVNLRDKWKTF